MNILLLIHQNTKTQWLFWFTSPVIQKFYLHFFFLFFHFIDIGFPLVENIGKLFGVLILQTIPVNQN